MQHSPKLRSSLSNNDQKKKAKKAQQGERLVWLILLIFACLVSYKLGQRSRHFTNSTHSEPNDSITSNVNETAQNNHQMNEPTEEESSASVDENLQFNNAFTCPPPVCPPCDCSVKPKPKPKRKKRRPPPPKEISPVDRQKLLAWVKRYSPRLKRCRDAGQGIYRLHANVGLSADKTKILKAKVKGNDVPQSALSCVERDLRRWPAPTKLSKSHPPQLIFGLQLD